MTRVAVRVIGNRPFKNTEPGEVCRVEKRFVPALLKLRRVELIEEPPSFPNLTVQAALDAAGVSSGVQEVVKAFAGETEKPKRRRNYKRRDMRAGA